MESIEENKLKKKCGIYKITSPSNKIYIGQAVNIYPRYMKYKNLDCIGQPRLYRSIVKHGFDSHVFEVIEECIFEDLNIRERYWQDFYNVLNEKGLNCVLTKTEEKKMVKSEETLKKMSEAMSGERHFLFGKKHSEETRQKMSKSQKEKSPISEETRLKMSKAQKGKKMPKEAIDAIQKARKIIREEKGFLYGKLVLSLETGIFYNSVKEAAEAYGVKKDTFGAYLRGDIKTNKFNCIFA